MSDPTAPSPAVSLIVVNHQGGDQIGPCLESLVQHADAPFELFVVDNASTDGSLDTVRVWADGRPGVEVVASP